jgi:tetratricopeptide (TPR) repeat protein
MFRTILGAGLLAGTMLAPAAFAHDHGGHNMTWGTLPTVSAATPAGAEVQLWEGLGPLSFPVTTSNPTAQLYVNQGLVFAYGFNHWEAQRAFQAAQKLDPQCAMCFWGEALVLGPNINWPMEEAAVAPAFAAVQEAMRLAPKASAREQALIAALAERYAAEPVADRAPLDQAYAEAMRQVAADYPDDLNIQTLYAEAVMDLSPWNYWENGGATPKPEMADVVPTLEKVLAKNPDHAGAIHLYIHAVEASDRPERAEPYADRLAQQKLSTGHLIHMPAHIYFRVGRYIDSLEANKVAVAADEAYLAQVEVTGGIYPYGYYPHNIHFVLVSAAMAGDAATALGAAEKLDRTVTEEAARTVPLAQPVKVAPLFAYAQFGTADQVMALAEPADDLPYVKGVWHYARGVALAAAGDAAGAAREAEAIAAIIETADLTTLEAFGIPAADVLEIARRVIAARVAQAGGDLKAAIGEFEAAAEIEDGLPFMEPAFWYYPVRQSLGGVLLAAGETERAEEQFRLSLEKVPNNGWACFGLLEANKLLGDGAEAAALQERLDRTWAGDKALLDLSRL